MEKNALCEKASHQQAKRKRRGNPKKGDGGDEEEGISEGIRGGALSGGQNPLQVMVIQTKGG